MDAREQKDILTRFADNLIRNSVRSDPDIDRIVSDNFWDMFQAFGDDRPDERGINDFNRLAFH